MRKGSGMDNPFLIILVGMACVTTIAIHTKLCKISDQLETFLIEFQHHEQNRRLSS